MRKPVYALAIFVFAFAIGMTQAYFAPDVQAKPTQCRLAIEPFLYCEASNSCHGAGEMLCWECRGTEPGGAPCLCTRLGCMVP